MSAAEEYIGNSRRGLIPIERVDALELFTQPQQLDKLLIGIKAELTAEVADITTANGRKAIAHRAAVASSTKVFLDNAGKDKVSELKELPKTIDAGRRHMRDFLDNLRDEIRRPLTEWEEGEARKEIARRLAEEVNAAHVEALQENDLRDRERRVREQELELERRRLQQEAADRERQQAADRLAREEQIRLEAENKAKRQAEEAVERERLRAEQAVREKAEAEERAKREAEERDQRERDRATQVERDRIAALERAEQERLEAVEAERRKAAQEAEDRERRRQADEERKRRDEAARAADKAHRDQVNASIVAAFAAEGVGEKTAQRIIQLVASGSIPAMSIRY